MTATRNGLQIYLTDATGKLWAWVETTAGPAPFSFEDQRDAG